MIARNCSTGTKSALAPALASSQTKKKGGRTDQKQTARAVKQGLAGASALDGVLHRQTHEY